MSKLSLSHYQRPNQVKASLGVLLILAISLVFILNIALFTFLRAIHLRTLPRLSRLDALTDSLAVLLAVIAQLKVERVVCRRVSLKMTEN